MTTIEYDIIAKIRFYTIKEGGRKTSTPDNYFGCPLLINDSLYDCRLLLDEVGSIHPGSEIDIPIKLLDSKTVLKFLKKGTTFQLWEGRTIAEGRVLYVNSLS